MLIHTPIEAAFAESVEVFRHAFAQSEGAAEGAAIASLVQELLRSPKADVYPCAAVDQGCMVAAVVFSRLVFSQDARRVFLLSPMAVLPDFQRRGYGQALIQEGLNMLRSHGVDLVLTYGDPAYYQQVGFAAMSQAQARPPHPLEQPQGWLGQSLDGHKRWPPLLGTSHCVAALDQAQFW